MILKQEVADFIVYLLKCIKSQDKNKQEDMEDYSIKGSAKYLLNHLIRQMKIPDNQMYVSQKALDRWNEITDDNIKEKSYNNKVSCKINWNNHEQYKGANKNAGKQSTAKGKKFKYNDVFHDEHIVPVSVIINELLTLNLDNNSNLKSEIEDKLGHLTMCKILKEEDRAIKHKHKRSFIVEEVLKTDYKDIAVYNFNEIYNNKPIKQRLTKDL